MINKILYRDIAYDKKNKRTHYTNNKISLSKILKDREALTIPKFYEENLKVMKNFDIVNFEVDNSIENCEIIANSYYFDPNRDHVIDPIVHTLNELFLKMTA